VSSRLSTHRLKLVALLGVTALLGVVLTALVVPPADGYEISLYAAYPVFFWVLVLVAFVCGGVVIFGSAAMEADDSWMAGALLMLLTNAVLLLMPYIRGYPILGRDDPMSHLGFVLDLTATGGIGGNIYPSLHLIVRTLSYATGLEPIGVMNAVPPVFSLVFFLSLALLLFELFGSRRRVLLGLPFALFPVLEYAQVNPRPYDMAVLLVPFVFYLLVKAHREPSPGTRTAFVVAIVATSTFHPLIPLFLVPVLTVLVVANRTERFGSDRPTPVSVVLLPLVVAVAWYQNFLGIIFRFRRIYNILFGLEESTSQLDQYSDTIAETSPELVDVLKFALFTHGVEALLFGLGFAALAALVLFGPQRRVERSGYLVTFATMLSVFSLGGLAFLLLDLIVPPQRPFQMAKLAAIVLGGGLFYILWRHLDRDLDPTWAETESRPSRARRGLAFAFVGLLVAFAFVSTFSLYPSPLNTEDNPQVSRMELSGTEWVIENRDEDDSVMEIGIRYRRFYHAQFGTETYTAAVQDGYGQSPPPRFNYTEYGTLGESYPVDRYLMVAEGGRQIYPATFPDYRQFWRYTPENYDRLERDPTVDRVYANGDLEFYRVEGTRAESTDDES
jgi:hypothetical protein